MFKDLASRSMYTLVATSLLVLAGCGSDITTPEESPSLSLVSGDAQTALAGSTLASPLVARVTVTRGRNNVKGVEGVIVRWRVLEGGGSVYAGVSKTDADGYVREWWTLGESGPQRVEVRSVDASSGERQMWAAFTAEAN